MAMKHALSLYDEVSARQRIVLILAATLVAGAVYLAVTRAEALLLDLGGFAGCL